MSSCFSTSFQSFSASHCTSFLCRTLMPLSNCSASLCVSSPCCSSISTWAQLPCRSYRHNFRSNQDERVKLSMISSSGLWNRFAQSFCVVIDTLVQFLSGGLSRSLPQRLRWTLLVFAAAAVCLLPSAVCFLPSASCLLA